MPPDLTPNLWGISPGLCWVDAREMRKVNQIKGLCVMARLARILRLGLGKISQPFTF
jgi:hypothetical protein